MKKSLFILTLCVPYVYHINLILDNFFKGMHVEGNYNG